MTDVLIDVTDAVIRTTLKVMLEADGFAVSTRGRVGEVVITDEPRKAVDYAAGSPTLILANAGAVPQAVSAMRNGVYGYIFLPFQPGEAAMMVRKAVAGSEKDTAPTQPGTLPIAQEEMRLIKDALRACKNNKTEAARLLGIGRNTLWRKLKKDRDRDRQQPAAGS